MSKIKLTGENSGYVEISAGQNAGNNTLELPTSGTKVVASDDSGNVDNLGIVTATTFSGNITGNVTGDVTLATGATISGSTNTITALTNGSERVRIDSSGNVGIGTTNPATKLEVYSGKIRAGTDQATNGTTIIEGHYSEAGDVLNILGSHYSNGATILSYGMRPKTGSSGYVSSFGNFSSGRVALEMWGNGAQIVTAPAQQTAIGSDVTSVAGAVMVRNNGDVTMRGTDSQYIEMASFRTTNGNTADTGLVALNGGDLDFTPIQNTNDSVIVHSTVTNPSRITFSVAGVVHLNYHQDIKTGNATTSAHYEHIKVKLNGSNANRNALITSTSGFWDSIIGTATIEVAANDYIELELSTNTSIVSWDDSGWSSYNFIFAPINTNR